MPLELLQTEDELFIMRMWTNSEKESRTNGWIPLTAKVNLKN